MALTLVGGEVVHDADVDPAPVPVYGGQSHCSAHDSHAPAEG